MTENRLDRDTPLKFDIWHSLTAGVEWRADGGGHSYSKTPLPIEKEIWRLSHYRKMCKICVCFFSAEHNYCMLISYLKKTMNFSPGEIF